MYIEGVHCSIPFSVHCSVLAELFYESENVHSESSDKKEGFPPFNFIKYSNSSGSPLHKSLGEIKFFILNMKK